MRGFWTWGWKSMAAYGLSLSLPAVALTHDPERGWGTTKNVDFSLITYTLDQYPCMRSEEDFLGCVQMVNAMGLFNQPPVALSPKTSWAGARVTALRDFGALTLVQVDDPGDAATGLGRTSVLYTRQYALRQASTAAFRQQRDRIKGRSKVEEIEFDQLTKEFLDKRVAGVSEPYAIGYATNALLAAHDAHSSYSVRAYEQANWADPDETYVGIGAAVQEMPGDTRLQLYRVLEGSPAQRAGLRSLDILLRIGNQNASSLRNNQFATILRENAGKSIPFIVERDGVTLAKPVMVTPAKISVPNVESRVLNDMGQKVLHVRVRSFLDENVCAKVHAALVENFLPPNKREDARKLTLETVAPEIRGVVLDLRDNRGGLIDKAACVAGLFVGPRRIAIERSILGDGRTLAYDSTEARLTSRPVAVLINDMTASAAEIVAGALQDYANSDVSLNHVFLVGTRSHGKGSVQRIEISTEFPELLRSDTVARYQLPLDHTNHLVGLLPDFEVFRALDPTPEDLYAIREADFSFIPRAAAALGAWGPPLERASLIRSYGKDCFRGQSENIWTAAGGRGLDFQLLKAQELVGCRPSI